MVTQLASGTEPAAPGRPRAVNRRSTLTNADNHRQLRCRSEPHQPTSAQLTNPPVENQGKTAAGFPAVEAAMGTWAAGVSVQVEWGFTNVFGPNGEPLNWWQEF